MDCELGLIKAHKKGGWWGMVREVGIEEAGLGSPEILPPTRPVMCDLGNLHLLGDRGKPPGRGVRKIQGDVTPREFPVLDVVKGRENGLQLGDWEGVRGSTAGVRSCTC